LSQPLDGIRAIVFDAVGTLLHPDPSAAKVYTRVGKQFGSRLASMLIAQRFRDAFAAEEAVDRRNGFRTSETRERERWQQIVRRVLDDVPDAGACFAALYEHFSRPDAWRCEEAAAAVIATLGERGYTLGLASNYDHRLRSVVAGIPALHPLRHLIISSEVGWRKPAPQFFAAVRAALDLRARQIVYVGDDFANDYEGALAGGLQAVLFDPKDSVKTHSVTRVATLHDLPPLFSYV
jgi:putative hydrolase of the HAD superfamily